MTHSVRKQNNQIEAFPSVTHAALRWADRKEGQNPWVGQRAGPTAWVVTASMDWTAKQASKPIHPWAPDNRRVL